MSNISIKQAAFINFISRYSNVLIQLFINSILARVLTPNDYGVVAVVSVFTTFFSMLADMGIGPAIIQNKELDDKDISNIFLFTVITGFIVSVLFALFSYPISIFYDNDIYIELCKVLSISIFFNIINIVPNALVLKNKLFKVMGIRTIIITILGGIITFLLALNGFKYYSLVLNSIVISVLLFFSNLSIVRLRIYKSFDYKSIEKIKKFSTYQLKFNFVNYFARNLDNLFIGKIFGQVELGYYDKAYRLMLYPVQNFTHIITPILHPILSDYQNDKDIIYKKYMKLNDILSIFGIFCTIFCFWTAREIIVFMFGYNWVDSVESFKYLSLSIWPQMISGISGTIFQSLGKTQLLYKCGLITTFVNISCIIIGICSGSIEDVSKMICTAYFINFFIATYFLVNISFNNSYMEILKFVKDSLLVFVVSSLFVILFSRISINNIILSILYKLIVSFIIVFTVYIFYRKFCKS